MKNYLKLIAVDNFSGIPKIVTIKDIPLYTYWIFQLVISFFIEIKRIIFIKLFLAIDHFIPRY